MPFFLLSRDDNDELRLLTTTASPTRQDALAALSSLTTESGFDAWDLDVVLVDLDAALPVLLVRPAEGTPPVEPEPVDEQASERLAAWEPRPGLVAVPFAAEEEELEAESEVETAPPSVIPAEEAEAFASYVSSAADEESAVPALIEDSVSVSGMSLPLPDLAMELEPEAAPLPAEETLAGPSVESRARAVDEEADGLEPIEPIESGLTESAPQEPEVPPVPEPESELLESEPEPALEPEPAELETVVVESDPVWVDPEPATADAESSESADANDELRDALLRTTVAMKEEALAEMSDEPSPPDSPQAEPVIETWPWAVALAPAVQTVTEPHGASATGDVAEAPEPDAAPTDVVEAPEPDAAVAEIPEAPLVSEEPSEAPAKESDFLKDLEPIPPAAEAVPPTPEPVAVAAPQHVVEPASMEDYVCTDCVYVNTCPNKDQRLPRDCGSFQWK